MFLCSTLDRPEQRLQGCTSLACLRVGSLCKQQLHRRLVTENRSPVQSRCAEDHVGGSEPEHRIAIVPQDGHKAHATGPDGGEE